MTRQKKMLIGAMSVNILVVLLEVFSFIAGFILRWDQYRFKAFLYYTQDSNLFAMAACLLMAVSQAECLLGRRAAPSRLAQHMKYMAACALSLTFLVVLFILVPLAGWDTLTSRLFSGTRLYHHFLCPILTVFSFLFLEDYRDLPLRNAVFALIPTACYAAILTGLNIFHLADGPYPFFKVYDQPVWVSLFWTVLILGSAYAIAAGLLALNHWIMNHILPENSH